MSDLKHIEWTLTAVYQRLIRDIAIECNQSRAHLWRRDAHLEAWLNENLPPDYGNRHLEGLILGGSPDRPNEGETTTAYARRVLTDAVEGRWEYEIEPAEAVGDKGAW